MINPEIFFWNESMSIDDMQLVELVGKKTRRGKLFSTATLKRLLGGDVNIRYIFKMYYGRLSLALESSSRNFARLLHIRLPNISVPNSRRSGHRECGSCLYFRAVNAEFLFLKCRAVFRLDASVKAATCILSMALIMFSKLDSRTVLRKTNRSAALALEGGRLFDLESPMDCISPCVAWDYYASRRVCASGQEDVPIALPQYAMVYEVANVVRNRRGRRRCTIRFSEPSKWATTAMTSMAIARGIPKVTAK